MNRAKSGESITVAALGGSITEGWGASDRSSTCYAALYADWWRTAFPMSEVTFVNAGIGGTTSYFGAHRLDEAVISKSADVCVIDFTVNDRTDAHFLASYESIIARLLANDVAVIALYMIDENGFNVKTAHHKIVEKYRIPSISYADAIWQTFSDGTRVWDDISDDTIHPNDAGHAYTAELFWRYLNSIYEYCPEQVVATRGIDAPFLLIPKYHYSYMADSDSTLISVSSYKGFEKNTSKVIKNHTNGWYSATGVGEICFSASFDTLGMLYKNSASGEVRGGFDVYVDGKLVSPHTASKAYFGMTEILYESEDVAHEHTVKIVFNGEYGSVTVGGFLLSTEADAGMYGYPCIKCGKTDGAMQVLKQTGHDLKSDITLKPTTSSVGERKHSCDCGYSFTEELPAITLTTIGDMYLNATDDINVFYAVDVPANAQNVYAVFTFRGKQYTVTDYTVLEDGSYVFTYSGIAPSFMNYKIGIEVFATFYGDEYSVKSDGSSIREYYERALTEQSNNTALLRLLSDLLIYGEKAQLYTGIETGALVTDGLSLTPTAEFIRPESILALSGSAVGAVADWTGVGLHCDERVGVYFTFTATDINALTVTVTLNGRTYEYTAEDFIEVAAGKYRINVECIYAHEFDDEITAFFSVGGDQQGRSLTYSVNSYVSAAYSSAGNPLSDLLAAICNYGASAAAYKSTL